MSDLFRELKRRRVFRAAAIYVAVAFGVIQAADVLTPALRLPEWTVSLVAVLTILGLPLALVVAWMFDATPAGLERTPEPVPVPAARRGGRAAFLATGAAVALALLAGGGWWAARDGGSAGGGDRKSIAVLPFASLSADQENAYFADGVHDELLTQLSKIGDLKVISRTSVLQYRDGERNLREIGAALGVATVLEGSVQRSGNRVRVTAQLIDARTDEHLWAERFDRDLSDVFAIQTEIAQAIVGALEARLTTGENARLSRRPTENAEAYDQYLRAREYMRRGGGDQKSNWYGAVQLLERAIELDPDFALARTQLSVLHSQIYWFAYDQAPGRLARARAEIDEAFRLDPEMPEAHLALGAYRYWGERDYEGALAEFERALRDAPNSAEVHSQIANVLRRQGKWEESLRARLNVSTLDPRNVFHWRELGDTYLAMRRWDDAERAYDRAVALAPDNSRDIEFRGVVRWSRSGRIEELDAAIRELPAELWQPRYMAALHGGDYDGALAQLELQREAFIDWQTSYAPRSLFSAWVHAARGDAARARAAFDSARVAAEAAVRERPNDWRRYMALGHAFAGLGRKSETLRALDKLQELLPMERDAYWAPFWHEKAAMMLAAVGETEAALDKLEWLLSIPGPVHVAGLRTDPRFAPLRGHPRFQKLVSGE